MVKSTEQELLWAKQHAQWFYDKSETHDESDMLPILLRIQSMKECLRLSQDGEIQSIERIMNKASKSKKDTNGQSDTEEQLPSHEVYDAPLIGPKKIDTSKRTTRSVTRLRARNFPEPITLSDVESDD